MVLRKTRKSIFIFVFSDEDSRICAYNWYLLLKAEFLKSQHYYTCIWFHAASLGLAKVTSPLDTAHTLHAGSLPVLVAWEGKKNMLAYCKWFRSRPFLSIWVSLVAQMVKNSSAMQETWIQSLGWEDPLEEGMATHSSILAWRIPRRGAWRATVHGVIKSQTRLGN